MDIYLTLGNIDISLNIYLDLNLELIVLIRI